MRPQGGGRKLGVALFQFPARIYRGHSLWESRIEETLWRPWFALLQRHFLRCARGRNPPRRLNNELKRRWPRMSDCRFQAGSRQSAPHRAQGRRAIFNPRGLNPTALVDFCGACHRTWNDVYEMEATGVANARFQPYRLESSRCWGEGDARLACTTCHDSHQQLVHDEAI